VPNKHGDFIWYELMTNDAEAAQKFYSAVVGWSFAPAGKNDKDYRQFSMDSTIVGGLLPLTLEMTANGARPCWSGYIGVDDVDQTAARIEKAGGNIHMAPQDIPDVGRVAFVADPQGVMFYIMTGASDRTSNSFAATEPMVGHCAWNELATTDQAGAVAFYTDQFGWRQEGDMDMGPIGKYQFLYQGKGMIGAVMPKVPGMPVSAWSYYFRVPDIDKAVSTIKGNGGKILQEPIEIPGGDFAMSGMDPQGASFALVGARK
jgi:predicted enzyme related to lactoylglutathione lyase